MKKKRLSKKLRNPLGCYTFKGSDMVLQPDKLKKHLNKRCEKNLDDYNAFIWKVCKDVGYILLEGELNDHLGF